MKEESIRSSFKEKKKHKEEKLDEQDYFYLDV